METRIFEAEKHSQSFMCDARNEFGGYLAHQDSEDEDLVTASEELYSKTMVFFFYDPAGGQERSFTFCGRTHAQRDLRVVEKHFRKREHMILSAQVAESSQKHCTQKTHRRLRKRSSKWPSPLILRLDPTLPLQKQHPIHLHDSC